MGTIITEAALHHSGGGDHLCNLSEGQDFQKARFELGGVAVRVCVKCPRASPTLRPLLVHLITTMGRDGIVVQRSDHLTTMTYDHNSRVNCVCKSYFPASN